MANEAHLEILRSGVSNWNTWRQSTRERPDLTDSDLSGISLREGNFQHVDFSRAKLDAGCLRSCDFSEATLSYASFAGTDASESVFDRAVCVGTNFRKAKLIAAYLTNADMRNADFTGASLVRAECEGANFSNSSFSHAYLNEAFFDGTILDGAAFDLADASGVNFSGARGLTLDRTLARNAVFSPYAGDSWSVLRRNYTGARFMVHMLLLILFFLPMVVKAFVWSGVNRGQHHLLRVDTQLRTTAEALKAKTSTMAKIAGRVVSQLSETQPCLAETCRQFTIWQILLGVDQGWISASLTIALLIYNVSRGLLTLLVAPLRDEEERSGFAPARRGLTGYGWLVWPHRLVRSLLFIALGSFLWHGYHWLTSSVYLPPIS